MLVQPVVMFAVEAFAQTAWYWFKWPGKVLKQELKSVYLHHK